MRALDLAAYHMWWKREGARGIRAILMDEWDPIGVSEIPEARDEYDTYVGGVGVRLREGVSTLRLAWYLARARTSHIGLPADPLGDYRTARRLRRWYADAMVSTDCR